MMKIELTGTEAIDVKYAILTAISLLKTRAAYNDEFSEYWLTKANDMQKLIEMMQNKQDNAEITTFGTPPAEWRFF